MSHARYDRAPWVPASSSAKRLMTLFLFFYRKPENDPSMSPQWKRNFVRWKFTGSNVTQISVKYWLGTILIANIYRCHIDFIEIKAAIHQFDTNVMRFQIWCTYMKNRRFNALEHARVIRFDISISIVQNVDLLVSSLISLITLSTNSN